MNVSISAKSAPISWARSTPRSLKVGGITPFSATDYPGKFAAVVFVQGCPLRCGYCHNPHLQKRTSKSSLQWPRVVELLKRRIGLIDVVVFSGGEPTVDPALEEAICEVRALGFGVGLHTAGCYPRRLAAVLPILDWIGLDIKAPFDRYQRVTGSADGGHEARTCVEMVVASGIDFECRTTIHPALLQEAEIAEMATTLSRMGVTKYALQRFRSQGCGDNLLKNIDTAGYPSNDLIDRVLSLFAQFSLRTG